MGQDGRCKGGVAVRCGDFPSGGVHVSFCVYADVCVCVSVGRWRKCTLLVMKIHDAI